MRRLIMAASLLLASSQALAHAHLESSTPAAGAELDVAPKSLTLNFSEELETMLSDVAITDAQGKAIEVGDLDAATDDASIISIELPKLTDGVYRVSWEVTSVDTHRSEGEFAFQVAGDD